MSKISLEIFCSQAMTFDLSEPCINKNKLIQIYLMPKEKQLHWSNWEYIIM